MPLPIDAFHDSLEDANILLTIAKAFPNKRTRRMRKELRNRVGDALRINGTQRESLDCIENDQVFLLFKLNSNQHTNLQKTHLADTRPLLRQSIVAACAAFESFLADKTMTRIGPSLRASQLPNRLKEIPLTIGHWAEIEGRYKRRKWGIRLIVEEAIRENASTAPNKVGILLSMIGIKNWSRKIDQELALHQGTTIEQLDAITLRRNQIAHAADKIGSGRASLTAEETETFLTQIRKIAEAIDVVVDKYAIK